MECSYCNLLKGMTWAEATLNCEKIKPIALATVELCLAGVIQLAEISFK